jgi:excisionase family DNA binding protein
MGNLTTYKKWLQETLNYFLEWEAVGWNYHPKDTRYFLTKARDWALRLEQPDIAALCTGNDGAAVMSACLAALNKSEFITLAEAARVLGMSQSGLRKLVRRGAIQYQQAGKNGRIRFRRDWLNLQHPTAAQCKHPTTASNSRDKLRVYFPSTG